MAAGFFLWSGGHAHIQRAILNFTPGHQGQISPRGVNLSPCPLGEVHPVVHPQG
jgi:hypothetical protein